MVEFYHKLPSRIEIVRNRKKTLADYVYNRKVLHIGCTDSGLVQERIDADKHLHLMMLKNASRVWGIDIDRQGLDELRNLGVKDLFLWDAEKLDEIKLDDKPDLIIASEVLEHLSNPGRFLDAARKLECELVISVPNAFSYRIMQLMETGNEFVHEDHNFYYSYTTLKTLTGKHGWELKNCKVYYWSDATDITQKLVLQIEKNPFFAEGLIFFLQPKKAFVYSQPVLIHSNNNLTAQDRLKDSKNCKLTECDASKNSVLSNDRSSCLPACHKPVKRIVFFAHNDNFRFVNPIIAQLTHEGYETRAVKLTELTRDKLFKHLQWSDFAWFEWAKGPALTTALQMPKVTRIIVRLHRYEAYSDFPKSIDWTKVDHLIFVSQHVVDAFTERNGIDIRKVTDVHVIPNSINLNEFPFTNRERGFNIASISRIIGEKNLPLMLQIMSSLVKKDHRYRLFQVGWVQDAYLEDYLKHMIHQMGLQNNIIFEGENNNIVEWLSDKHYLLSTSVIEGHPVNIMEGMACGLKPIIHNYFGNPEEQFGKEFVFNDVEQATEMILSSDYRPAYYRQVISKRYSLELQMQRIEKLFKKVASITNNPQSKTEPLISTVIFTYNRSNMLPEAIRSVLAQDYDIWELLILDDGSTDNTEEIVTQFKDNRIRYIKCEHKGAPAARNRAITEAKGEFIVWLGSDDELLPHALSSHVNMLSKFPNVDVFYGDFLNADENMQVTGQKKFYEWYGRKSQMIGNFIYETTIPDGGSMVRKTCYDKVGKYDESFLSSHDRHFWIRLAKYADFKHVGVPIYKRRLHKSSITVGKREKYNKYHPGIIRLLKENYTLKELFPNLQWGNKSNPVCEKEALCALADQMLQSNDTNSACEFLMEAYERSSDIEIKQMIDQISHKSKQQTPQKVADNDNVIKDGSNNVLISVIIFTYNRADLLPYAIQSVLNQSYNGWELLIIDDGSNDNTESVVKSFDDNRIQYVKCEHLGAPTARNRGITEAHGEFIAWLGSDDALLPDALSRFVEAHRKYPEVDVLYGDHINADEHMKAQVRQVFHDWYGMKPQMISRLVFDTVVPDGGSMIRKSCYDKVGGYNVNFPSCHDDEFWSRLIKVAEFKHIGAPVYKRRLHPSSMTRGKKDVQNIYHPKIIKLLLERYTLQELFPDLPWNSQNNADNESEALIAIAGRLVEKNDFTGALELLDKAYNLNPSDRIAKLTEHVKVSIDSLKEKSVFKVYNSSKDFPTPFFSILIPSYNRQRYIEDAVRSAINQEYPNFEVIVVDDGSTDKTAEIVDSIASPRLRQVRCEHRGAPATRNRAIQESRGEFIVWLDSDDIMLPGVLNDYAAMISAHPDVDVLYGRLVATDERLNKRGGEDYPEWWERKKEMIATFFQHDAIPNPVSCVRKECYSRIGGYDETFRRAHDYEWFSRLLPYGKFKRVLRPVCLWRWHTSNLSSGSVKIDTSFEIRIVKKMLEHHSLNELFPDLDWNNPNLSATEATACLKVADRLLKLGDYPGAIEWTKKSQSFNPRPQTAQLQADLQQVIDLGLFSDQHKSSASSNSGLKVLLVAQGYPPHSLAGTELYTQNLARELTQRGANVTVIVPERNPSFPNGRVITEWDGDVRLCVMNLHPLRGLLELASDPLASARFEDWLKNERFDVVHIHHLIAFTAGIIPVCARQNCPIILTMHDAYLFCDQFHLQLNGSKFCSSGPQSCVKCANCFHIRSPQWDLDRYGETLQYMKHRLEIHRNAIADVDTILAPSKFLIDKLHEFDFKHSDIRLSPLGINKFDPLPNAARNGKIRFLYLGNITRVKGVDLALEAFANLENVPAQLDIYGQNFEPAILEQGLRTMANGNKVKYNGPYKPQDLPNLFSGADVLVLPSRFEQFSLVAREALHAKIPVIAPNIGGLPDIIEDGINGLLFEAGNSANLADKMQKIIEHPPLIDELRAGIRPIKGISEDADEILAIYAELMNKKKGLLRQAV